MPAKLFNFYSPVITLGSIYSLVALGFTMIYNATGIINLAQGEFVMFGGLIMVFCTMVLKIPLYIGFGITILAVAFIGALFERLAIHPLQKASMLTLIMITLAGSILFRGIAMFIWGRDPYTVPQFSSGPPVQFLGATLQLQFLWILAITGLVVFCVSYFFNRTLLGKAITACAFNPLAARLIGH